MMDDILVFIIDGAEYRIMKSWLLGVTYKRSWIDADYFDLTIHFATMGPSSLVIGYGIVSHGLLQITY